MNRNQKATEPKNSLPLTLLVSVAIVLVLGLSPSASADSLTAITSSSAFVPTDSVDWSTFVATGTSGSNHLGTASSGLYVSSGGVSGYQVNVQVPLATPVIEVQSNGSSSNGSWFGDFSPGSNVIDNNFPQMLVSFTGGGVNNVGFQIQNADASNPNGPNNYSSNFTVLLTAYTGNMQEIGAVCMSTDNDLDGCTDSAHDGLFTVFTAGTVGNTADGSAPFIGVSSDMPITELIVGIRDISVTGDFAIDSLETGDNISTPEPGTILLLASGMGLIARCVRRKEGK